MRFFKEIREVRREEKLSKDKDFDPDKLIDPVEDILVQAQANADKAWEEFIEYARSYDPDKLIVVS